jgi:N-acetylglutamate synthase-like GNAT family acetyltransferase
MSRLKRQSDERSTVRRFEPKDQAEARTVVLEGLREHFGFLDPSLNPDLEDIQASFITRGDDFYVVENDGRIVGTAGLLFAEGRARIVRMSVAKNHRKRGIATALLQQCIETASQRGFSEIWAYTQPEWPDAVSFYSGSGFEQVGRDEIDIHLRLRFSERRDE